MTKWSPGCHCTCCVAAPSRTNCQYRSGANGQTVATRPTVAITVAITGTGTPDCGGCNFTEYYTYTCGTNISDVVEDCTFTGTWPITGVPDDCQRYIQVTINGLGNGFIVVVSEHFLYPTPPTSGQNGYNPRTISQTFTYDDFAYTDCQGAPQTDNYGAVTFTSASQAVTNNVDPGEEKCDIAATITAVNN